jgi:Putative F0F1-ATPase subunit Ca2+/Mg2+ transporter
MDETTPPTDPDADAQPPKAGPPLAPGVIELLTLGMAGALSLVAGGAIGYFIDGWAGTSPAFTLVGLAFGVVVAVLMTIARVRKYL